MKKLLITAISLLGCAISAPAQVGSNIVSGLLHTKDSVRIYVDALVDGEAGQPGHYERIYSHAFIDSYTFKTPSYRDITVYYCTTERCKLFKVVEGGQSENFHEIDVYFTRNTTEVSYKVNASSGQFKEISIKTKY